MIRCTVTVGAITYAGLYPTATAAALAIAALTLLAGFYIGGGFGGGK